MIVTLILSLPLNCTINSLVSDCNYIHVYLICNIYYDQKNKFHTLPLSLISTHDALLNTCICHLCYVYSFVAIKMDNNCNTSQFNAPQDCLPETDALPQPVSTSVLSTTTEATAAAPSTSTTTITSSVGALLVIMRNILYFI